MNKISRKYRLCSTICGRQSKGEVFVPCSPAADEPVLCAQLVRQTRQVSTQRRSSSRTLARYPDIPVIAMLVSPDQIARQNAAMSDILLNLKTKT